MRTSVGIRRLHEMETSSAACMSNCSLSAGFYRWKVLNCGPAPAHNLRTTAPGNKNLARKYRNAFGGALKRRVGSCPAVVWHPNVL